MDFRGHVETVDGGTWNDCNGDASHVCQIGPRLNSTAFGTIIPGAVVSVAVGATRQSPQTGWSPDCTTVLTSHRLGPKYNKSRPASFQAGRGKGEFNLRFARPRRRQVAKNGNGN
jgi:hypothetical protein